MTAPGGERWGDLQTRVGSAIVMLLIGGVEVWLGGQPFALLVAILTGAMVWELATMARPLLPRENIYLGLVASLTLMAALNTAPAFSIFFLVIPAVALLFPSTADRIIFAVYGGVIMAAGYGLVVLRDTAGASVLLWLILVVIASDILGYFAGRSFGGPKFWPAISPKKTWSGTVAGWIGAGLVGLAFVLFVDAGWALILLSAVVAFAGQLGDIAESWVKRRTGVKDSSNLIPGHGGVLDRFDALIFAVLATTILGLILPLPFAPGN